jgi:dTDP-4-dehydrorhamnose 3,5-epimerase
MQLIDEPLPGVQILKPPVFHDARGEFVKTFHESLLADLGIAINLKEEFFSTSNAGVIRGMHFQIPPYDHQKIVYCIQGSVIDVVLDLRTNSPTYGRFAAFELSALNRHIVSIPTGFAHGFLSLEDHSTLIYKTDREHSPSHDAGVLWNGFGYNWPLGAKAPIISKRDSDFPRLEDLSNPF